MKKVVMSLALSVLLVLGVNAQEKGAWYIGAGDIANKAWTDWSVAPTVGAKDHSVQASFAMLPVPTYQSPLS